MTIRTDLTIDWASSPRIATVLSPSTEITMQDLVDTCRILSIFKKFLPQTTAKMG